MPSVNTYTGQIQVVIDNDSDCGNALEASNIPTLRANTWKKSVVGIVAETERSTVSCIGLKAKVSKTITSPEIVVNFDDIMARGQADFIVLTVATSVGGSPIDLTEPVDLDMDGFVDFDDSSVRMTVRLTAISYQYKSNLMWARKFIGDNDGDNWLEEGEIAEITVQLKGLDQDKPLVAGKRFILELIPPARQALSIERTMPDEIEEVMILE